MAMSEIFERGLRLTWLYVPQRSQQFWVFAQVPEGKRQP